MADDKQNSKSTPESERDRLPFEPGSNRKKKAVANASSPAKPAAASKSAKPAAATTQQPSKTVAAKVEAVRNLQRQRDARKGVSDRPATLQDSRIPDAVGKRMIRRIALFSGVPTALGLMTFVAAYFIIINKILELPNVVVVLTSLGFFGLGVIGVSYGVLSSSWDEDREGSLLGIEEFGTNAKRMVAGWKSLKSTGQQ